MRSKRLVLTILILCMLVVLAGCRVVAFEGLKEKGPKNNEVRKPKAVMVDLNPTLMLLTRRMIIRGETTLPEGTIVTIQLRPFDPKDNYMSIVNGGAEPTDEVKVKEDVEVDSQGQFGPVVFLRSVPELEERFRLEAIIDPRNQNKKVQELLGSSGERIKDSRGMNTVTEEEQEIIVIRKYTDLMTYEESGGTIDPRPFVAGEKGEEISPTGGPNLKN